jgi:hypothetical protein
VKCKGDILKDVLTQKRIILPKIIKESLLIAQEEVVDEMIMDDVILILRIKCF